MGADSVQDIVPVESFPVIPYLAQFRPTQMLVGVRLA
jgi:hypothetical protein